MSRIPGITDVNPKLWRVLQSVGLLKIGAVANNNPSSVGGTLTSVGLTDSSINWTPNVDIDLLSSDQMFNAHNAIETQWSHQFIVSLDQTDLYNIALSMSYDQSAVSSSSMLSLSGYNPSPYRCVQIVTKAPRNVADDSDALQYIEFYKAKILFDGDMEISSVSKSSLPIAIISIANASDNVGAVRVGTAITRPEYERSRVPMVVAMEFSSGSIETIPPIGFRLCHITIHYSEVVYGNVVVELDAGSGSEYDSVLRTFTNASGETDNFTEFSREEGIFESGDKIRISGSIGTATGFCRIVYEHYRG